MRWIADGAVRVLTNVPTKISRASFDFRGDALKKERESGDPEFDRQPENQQTSRMKATFDLPPDLIRAVKLRAVHEGRKLKDVAADLLKRGLSDQGQSGKPQLSKPQIEIQADGLPVVRCKADAPASRMSTDELLSLEQETLQQEDLQRLGLAL